MYPQLQGIVERRLTATIQVRMREEQVVLLQGPRSVGKSTLLREVAAQLGAELVDLDDLDTRDAATADPATFVSSRGPVCFDEYQHVPLLLDAIKAELNREGRPGRFVLAGSARHEALPKAAQALTGRLHRLPVYPLSQGEISGFHEDFLEKAFENPGEYPGGVSTTTRQEYVDRIVAGGFPVPLSRDSAPGRARWFDDYVRLTLERDVREIGRAEQAAALPRLLQRLAAQTAQVLNVARAASDLSLNERTADSYLRLLEAVFLVHRLPAWGSTLTVRSASRPKIHLTDSGLAARLSRLTPEKLALRQPGALTELGHLLETFVVGELMKQASWLEDISAMGHWRTRDAEEVDLVIERGDGAVVAFEVKAAQRVADPAMTPLRKLRDAVGGAFLAGIVLYLGSRSYRAEDRLHVIPVDRLWTAADQSA